MMKTAVRIIGAFVVFATFLSHGGFPNAAERGPVIGGPYDAPHALDTLPVIRMAQANNYMWQQQQQQQMWRQQQQQQQQQQRMLQEQQRQRLQNEQLRRQQTQDAERRRAQDNAIRSQRLQRQQQDAARNTQQLQKRRLADEQRRVTERRSRIRKDSFRQQQQALKKKQDEQGRKQRETSAIAAMNASPRVTLSPELSQKLQNLSRKPANDNNRAGVVGGSGKGGGKPPGNGKGGGKPPKDGKGDGSGKTPPRLSRIFNPRAVQTGGDNAKPAVKLSQDLQVRLETLLRSSTHQQTAQKIANGHAFEKHVLQQGEFGKNIRTRDQFVKHINNVMMNPTDRKQLSGNRTAYWHKETRTIVIHDPNSPDGGTAFQPKNGRDYFNNLR